MCSSWRRTRAVRRGCRSEEAPTNEARGSRSEAEAPGSPLWRGWRAFDRLLCGSNGTSHDVGGTRLSFHRAYEQAIAHRRHPHLCTANRSPLCVLSALSFSICLDLSRRLGSLSRSLSLCSLLLFLPPRSLSFFFLLCVLSHDLFLGPLSRWAGTNQGVVWNPSFVRYLS